MSRSYRRTPVMRSRKSGKSDKQDKRRAQRRWRRIVRLSLCQGRWDSLPILCEVSNVRSFAKRGKARVRTMPPEGGRAWWRLMGK